MSVFKKILSLCVCVLLLAGGVANASMLCCQADVKSDTSISADQSCHQGSGGADQSDATCYNCKFCVSATVLVVPMSHVATSVVSVRYPYLVDSFVSIRLTALDAPPKVIS